VPPKSGACLGGYRTQRWEGSRLAGIRLRQTNKRTSVRPQATSDRQRALPIRGSSTAYVDAHWRLPDFGRIQA